jgi:hypothetical protein
MRTFYTGLRVSNKFWYAEQMFIPQLHRKKKLDIIAHSLTKSGIPVWGGIPELIVKDLKASGYVIKKKKRK